MIDYAIIQFMWWEKIKQTFSDTYSALPSDASTSSYNSVLQKIATEGGLTYIPPKDGNLTGELHSTEKGIQFCYRSGSLPPGYDGAYIAWFKFVWPEETFILVEKTSWESGSKYSEDSSDKFSPFYELKKMNATPLNDRFVVVSENSFTPKLKSLELLNDLSRNLSGVKFLKGQGIDIWFGSAADEHDLRIILKFLKFLQAKQ